MTDRETERTGATTNIVEGELGDTGIELHQQGQRLANATGGTEDGDLGGLWGNGTISAKRPQTRVNLKIPGWPKPRRRASGRG